MTAVSNETEPVRTSLSVEILAALVCALVTMTLAVAPHFASLVKLGTLEYIADGDDVYYLSVSRIPYRGELTLRDPFCGPWEKRPTLYSWLQFVPAAILARALDTGPILVALVWRTVGGALTGLAVYALLRRCLAGMRHPVPWALAATLVCVADAGFVNGRSLVGDLLLIPTWMKGITPQVGPKAFGLYRVVTPLTNLGPMMMVAAALIPSPRGRGIARAAVGAIALGLCVYLYFFFWTAAAVAVAIYIAGVAALGMAGKIDRKAARRELIIASVILLGGLAIGAPQVVSNSRAFADPEFKPILQRMVRGLKLPPGHPLRAQNLVNLWVFAKLALGAVAIAALTRWRERTGLASLAILWCFTAAGYILANSAIVTGLEFENFHWLYVFSPFGEMLLIVAGAVVVERSNLARGRVGAMALATVPILLVIFALAYRPFEALQAAEPARMNTTLRELSTIRPALERLRPDDILAGPPEVNLAVLCGFSGLLYQYDQTAVSSVIPDQEVLERHALNGWLQGLDQDTYSVEARRSQFTAGELLQPGWEPEVVAAARLAIFDRLMAGESEGMLERYRPNVLLRRSSLEPPSRGGRWSRIETAPGKWSLWKRVLE